MRATEDKKCCGITWFRTFSIMTRHPLSSGAFINSTRWIGSCVPAICKLVTVTGLIVCQYTVHCSQYNRLSQQQLSFLFKDNFMLSYHCYLVFWSGTSYNYVCLYVDVRWLLAQYLNSVWLETWDKETWNFNILNKRSHLTMRRTIRLTEY